MIRVICLQNRFQKQVSDELINRLILDFFQNIEKINQKTLNIFINMFVRYLYYVVDLIETSFVSKWKKTIFIN